MSKRGRQLAGRMADRALAASGSTLNKSADVHDQLIRDYLPAAEAITEGVALLERAVKGYNRSLAALAEAQRERLAQMAPELHGWANYSPEGFELRRRPVNGHGPAPDDHGAPPWHPDAA